MCDSRACLFFCLGKEGVDPNFHGEKESEYVRGHSDIGNPHHPHPPIRSQRDLVGEGFHENYGGLVFGRGKLVYSITQLACEKGRCDDARTNWRYV